MSRGANVRGGDGSIAVLAGFIIKTLRRFEDQLFVAVEQQQ